MSSGLIHKLTNNSIYCIIIYAGPSLKLKEVKSAGARYVNEKPCKEKDMADAGALFEVLGPFKASIRTHLGEFADEWMRGKIALVRKLTAQIELESDTAKLKELRAELNDALLSVDDVTQVDERMGKMLEMVKKHVETLIAIRDLRTRHP